MNIKDAAQEVVDIVKAVGDSTGWKDGDETDVVVCWRDVKALHSAIEAIDDSWRSIKLNGCLNSCDGITDVARQFDEIAHKHDSSSHEVGAILMRWASRRISELESKLRDVQNISKSH